jgi:hypothetical protein
VVENRVVARPIDAVHGEPLTCMTRRVTVPQTARDEEKIMENPTNNATTESAPAQDESAQAAAAAGFSDRIRERARVVKTQIDAAEAKARQRWADSKARQRLTVSKASQRVQEVPVKLRSALQQAVGKVRSGLDLPSRRELIELAQRIDELDRKLGEYETQSSARKKRKNEQTGEWA